MLSVLLFVLELLVSFAVLADFLKFFEFSTLFKRLVPFLKDFDHALLVALLGLLHVAEAVLL